LRTPSPSPSHRHRRQGRHPGEPPSLRCCLLQCPVLQRHPWPRGPLNVLNILLTHLRPACQSAKKLYVAPWVTPLPIRTGHNIVSAARPKRIDSDTEMGRPVGDALRMSS
jgi:hypothetical protein